jgi:hypothetical protein
MFKKMSYIDVLTIDTSSLRDYEHKISKFAKKKNIITKKKLNLSVYNILKLKILICGGKEEIH